MKSSRETDIKRIIACVIITVLTLSNLSACNVSKAIDTMIENETMDVAKDDPPLPGAGKIEVIDINGDHIETEVDVVEEGEAEDNASLPDRNLAQTASELPTPDDYCYAYSMLDENTKYTYREIFSILARMLSRVELTSKDPDEVDLAFRAVMLDHPEIFYVKGYSIIKYMNGKTLSKIAFSGTYTMTREEVNEGKEKVEEYVEKVKTLCPQDAGDYDKIKFVYDYLITTNEYVQDSPNNQNLLSVVENGKTVCQGYTKAMQLLLTKMGVFCTLVNGTACGRSGVPNAEELKDAQNAEWGGHVWNIVRCNGNYYNVDVTWGDSGITLLNSDGTLSKDVEVNYEFFLVDDEYLEKTHDPKPVVHMPRCISMEDSFYQHEGLYFTGIDPAQFTRAFESALSSGSSIVFIKASDEGVYEDIRRHLFDEQNVFEYMGRTNVRYVEFPERNLLMISL